MTNIGFTITVIKGIASVSGKLGGQPVPVGPGLPVTVPEARKVSCGRDGTVFTLALGDKQLVTVSGDRGALPSVKLGGKGVQRAVILSNLVKKGNVFSLKAVRLPVQVIPSHSPTKASARIRIA